MSSSIVSGLCSFCVMTISIVAKISSGNDTYNVLSVVATGAGGCACHRFGSFGPYSMDDAEVEPSGTANEGKSPWFIYFLGSW
ncbi:hypothetical protein GBA52_029025 [Prunus armeniaca]|nr:hypothetical protein GBA52_029025 [Prunus armeniaca]